MGKHSNSSPIPPGKIFSKMSFGSDIFPYRNAPHRHFGGLVWFRGLTPQQQPGSYQGGEMMMKSVFWWRKPEHPEETTDLRQVTDETFSHIRPLPSPGIELGPQRCEAK